LTAAGTNKKGRSGALFISTLHIAPHCAGTLRLPRRQHDLSRKIALRWAAAHIYFQNRDITMDNPTRKPYLPRSTMRTDLISSVTIRA
jgi:hypothetical protein